MAPALSTPGIAREPRDQTREELDPLRVVGVAASRHRHPRGQDVARVEARIDAAERAEAAEHQAGADQQHDRQRDLADDERLADAAMPDAGADLARAVLQRLLHAAARAFERRREAADDRGRERDRGGEARAPDSSDARARDRRDSTGLIASSSARPHCATSRPSAPPSTHSTRLSVSSWRIDADAAGAERGANRDLALARRAARQQQVGDVRARDQQHEADRAGEHEQRRTQIAGELAVHRHEQRAPAGVELRELASSGRWRSCPSAPAPRSSATPGLSRAMALM